MDVVGNFDGITHIDESKSYKDLLKFKNIAVFDFLSNGSSVLNLVNGSATHSVPIAVNDLASSYAKLYNIEEISTTSEILPDGGIGANFDGSVFGRSILLGMTFAIVPMTVAIFLIEDREVIMRETQNANCEIFKSDKVLIQLLNASYNTHFLSTICICQT